MWNMEGIVVIGFCAQDYQTLRNHMRIPFVVYDGICGQTERIVNLSIDNSGGGEQVGRHFRALGHTRALCLSDNETGIDRDRIEGFSAALRRDTRSCCGSRCKKMRGGRITGSSWSGCGA